MKHTHRYFAILEIHSAKFTNHKQIIPSYLFQKLGLNRNGGKYLTQKVK